MKRRDVLRAILAAPAFRLLPLELAPLAPVAMQPPTLTSARVTGRGITITYSEALDP